MAKQIALTGVDGFDEFWAQYPKHKAKKEAQKAWNQIKPGPALRRDIAEALAWQRRDPQWLKDGGAYVPNAASWLRGERWDDEEPDGQAVSGRTARILTAAARARHA